MIYKRMIPMAQSKIYWRLNIQNQGGLSNLAYSSNNLKIYLEDWLKLLAYIATSSEGNNPMIYKHMIPMPQSKVYWRLNVQSQGGFIKPRIFIQQFKNILGELAQIAGLQRHIQWG